MRVTNSMISNLVTFNMQRSLSRFMSMEEMMSSGRRINKASDDPLGTLRDLDYRSELAQNVQMQSNISQARNWLDTYDSIAAELTNSLTSAKEIAISMSNGTYDELAREATANEVRSIFDQIMNLAGAQLEGKRMFSGYKTDTVPLSFAVNGVVYKGDSGQIQFQVDQASKMAVNLIGSDVFLSQIRTLGEDSDLNPGITTSTALADLFNGDGLDLSVGTFTIEDENLGISVAVDLTGATDINDVITTINTALAANVPPISNLTAQIGPQGNNIELAIGTEGQISLTTPLSNLNNGNGVDLTSGTILVSDGAAINMNVDFSGAATVGDIITRFNNAVAAEPSINNVSMQLNGDGTGFEIIDSNGVSLGLTISDTSEKSSTAADLGIIGDINPNLEGVELNPIGSFRVTEAGGSIANDLGLMGQFHVNKLGLDLDPILSSSTNLSDLKSNLGMELGEIIIRQGDLIHTVDLGDPALVTIQNLLDSINSSGVDVTAAINPDGRGFQVISNDPNKSFIISESDNGRTAKDLGLYGSSDIMGAMMLFEEALRENDQEGITSLVGLIDDALQQSINTRALVGAKALRLETTNSRLVQQNLNFTKLLSEVEDADITKLVTDLASMENNFQAALLAGAKIIQPSLLNFLS